MWTSVKLDENIIKGYRNRGKGVKQGSKQTSYNYFSRGLIGQYTKVERQRDDPISRLRTFEPLKGGRYLSELADLNAFHAVIL